MWPNSYCGMLQDGSRASQVVYNNHLQPISTVSPDFAFARQPYDYERFRRRPTNQRPSQQQGYRAAINPSKRHRDRLNQELDNLAKLLPFPEEVITRLDKLSVLRLSVGYLRNKNFLKDASKKSSTTKEIVPPMALQNPKGAFTQLFNEAIDGFMVVLTFTGVIFYISESVKSHLGYSQSQYLHQSMFSYIHDDDHEELRAGLEQMPTTKIIEINDDEESGVEKDKLEEEKPREFLLRMKSVLNSSSSDMYKPFKVTGHMRKLNYKLDNGEDQYGLFAMCTPARPSCSMLEIRIKSTLFCSKNRLDLTFLDLDARGKDFFGYSKKDIFGRSSYVMVHRADLQHLRVKHTEIINRGKTTMATFRLLCKSNDWTWICGYAKVTYKNHKEDFVVTTNRLMSDEEGDAILKIRDSEDVKSLGRLGLNRGEMLEEEAMKLGFPASGNFDFSAIEAGPMPRYPHNMDAVIAGSINDQHKTITDELLQENPEDLFDVSPELLNSSPENILSSPEDFSDAFEMTPNQLIKDPGYPFNSRPEDGVSTTCTSVRSDSISTMSDVSMEQQMLAYQRQQSASSSVSPCNPDGSFEQGIDSHVQKRNSLNHLAKTLHDLDVSVPPNVMVPMTDANTLLEMSMLENCLMQSNSMPHNQTRHITPPHTPGRTLTNLTSPMQQPRAYPVPVYEAFIQNKPYFPHPQQMTPEYRQQDFKSAIITERHPSRPNTVQYAANNSMPPPNMSNFVTDTPKHSQSTMNFTQYNMERPPNITISAPECKIEDMRTSMSTSVRSESSPKYPFVNPISPTISWSNSLGQTQNGNMDSEQMQPMNFNDAQTNQQQVYNMTRQLLNQQQQQQQGRSNGFAPQYFTNEPMQQQQFRDTASQGQR